MLLGKAEELDDPQEDSKEIFNKEYGWNQQKSRLMARAVREHEERLKDK